jgi:hypothetical protein
MHSVFSIAEPNKASKRWKRWWFNLKLLVSSQKFWSIYRLNRIQIICSDYYEVKPPIKRNIKQINTSRDRYVQNESNNDINRGMICFFYQNLAKKKCFCQKQRLKPESEMASHEKWAQTSWASFSTVALIAKCFSKSSSRPKIEGSLCQKCYTRNGAWGGKWD